MRGSITRRGRRSWRLKFDIEAGPSGKRRTRYVTVRGKRQDAERELTRLLSAVDQGSLVEPSKVTLGDYLRQWLGSDEPNAEPIAPPGLTPKTAERYRELSEGQIIPHLGAVRLQKLRPASGVGLARRASQVGQPEERPSGRQDGRTCAPRPASCARTRR
jgi:hypothetical protein